ncbi:protein ABHD15-like [Apostichopus japonicus]|uniref:protein ABHD15-like n=1 Tax=Stichopus japonicus TaxID=307972 RepID=UPI003AB3E6DE
MMSIGSTATTQTITLPWREMISKTETRSKWRQRNHHDTVGHNRRLLDTPNVQRECHLEKCHHYLTLTAIFLGNVILNFGRNFVQSVKSLFLFFFPRGELPKLYFKSSAMQDFLTQNCKILTSEYRCSPWLLSGWIQTLSNVFLRMCRHETSFTRNLFMAEDGGLVGLDWFLNGPTLRKRAPIVLVIPCNNILALSEAVICAHAYRKGFLPVVFRKRGSAGIPLTSSSNYQSFGECSDLREVIKFVRKLDPKRKLISMGVGTGASLLLAYLGEYGSSCHLQAAVCISPWYSLERQLSSEHNNFSQWVFLQSLKVELSRSAGHLQSKIDLDQAFGASSAEEYLRNMIPFVDNCQDLEGFYEQNEPLSEIDEIAIPLLCIHSLDDPVVQKNDIPFDLFETIPHVTLVTTRRGGHGSFLHGWKANNWALDLATDYCQNVLKVMGKPHLLNNNKCNNNNNNNINTTTANNSNNSTR